MTLLLIEKMLSDKDLVIASATMLTGILLIFTLFDFSVDEEIIYEDKKFQLEVLQEEIETIHNYNLNRTALWKSQDVNVRCEPTEVSFELEMECWNRVLKEYFNIMSPLGRDIFSYEENKAKETLLLSDKLQLLSLIVYALTTTSIFAILHSMLTPKFPISLQLAHASFMIAWIFVLFLALKLAEV